MRTDRSPNRQGCGLRRHLVAGVLLLAPLLMGLSLGLRSDWARASESSCNPAQASTCSLRQLADELKLRIGATVSSGRLGDNTYAGILAGQFNAVTPENDFKWYSVQPAAGDWHFEAADADLAFGATNGLAVKGHNLIWAQDQYTPAWVRGLGPAELQAAVDLEIQTEVGRYRGQVPRWDVVNEPLAPFGTGPSDNVFNRKLGKDWIAKAFKTAHDADPAAELWLNEYGTDWVPGKQEALVKLVKRLLRQGAPIYGVGLEMHRPVVDGPDVAALVKAMRAITSLGLRTALTEVDVPIQPGDALAPKAQAKAYGRIVAACLQVKRCREITVWGVDDGHSWLDNLGLFPTPTRPLLFDPQFAPKPAYQAVRSCLARAVLATRGATTNLPRCPGA